MWVYSFADYQQVFDLTEKDLRHSILDYPGAISSFNAEMHARGGQVVSGDEHYSLDDSAMQRWADDLLHRYEQHLRTHKQTLQGTDESSLQKTFSLWEKSQQTFLSDYAAGKKEGRYRMMRLPELPFQEREFRLALCSDLLFHTQVRNGYTPEQLVEELLRVAEEVRVYPLLNERGEISNELGPVMLALQQQNYGVEVRSIEYRYLKGGNAMLRVWTRECVVE